ncbi:hypothetical protein HMPREF0659_A7031 [Prevotella melaninogenica ATCC 25845]|nr:hypothetical protein HMPREF0659_A7031 [Prevotella melaninogenica ATCC 25845]
MDGRVNRLILQDKQAVEFILDAYQLVEQAFLPSVFGFIIYVRHSSPF